MPKKKLNCTTDEQLVSFYIAGCEEALEILVGRYQQKIFSYILTIVHDKDLAEDLFQDTFIKVIHTLRAGNYREEGKFNQWIMRITRNLIIDYFRKNQKMTYVDNNNRNDIFEFFSEPSISVEQCMISEQINNSLHSLIDLLPSEQKKVLTMRLYQDMSFKEIAELTDVSINTALGRMRYAILNLRKLVKEKNVILTY